MACAAAHRDSAGPARREDLNHDGNLLEQMLHICALGSGCLAHYIGHLTEQLQRQNMVRLENIKLRKELDASLETVSDSREHIAELKRLVGRRW